MEIKFSKCKNCRICGSKKTDTVLDYKSMPFLAEPTPVERHTPSFPLTVLKCKKCGYIYLKDVIDYSIYNEYIYTPQTSNDVVEYLKDFVRNTIIDLGLKQGLAGLEIGSGDGSLCNEFKNAGITFTGVEPSEILSKISREKNHVETYKDFLNIELAMKIGKFDLVIVRHVLEHIDDFHSFFKSIDIVLKPNGTLLIEVPYLGDILAHKQFYAFFFEHLSYFNRTSLSNLLKKFGFFINKTKFVNPEGGSILIYANRNQKNSEQDISYNIEEDITVLKTDLISFQTKFKELIKDSGPITAYGAGQRGITLLNLLDVSNENIIAIFDENPIYHGLYTPQSKIPIRNPNEMTEEFISSKVLILATSYEKQIRNKYKNMADRFISLSYLS